MGATTVTSGGSSSSFYLPKPRPSQKIFPSSQHLIYSNYRLRCSPQTTLVVQQSGTPPDDEISASFTGCRGCGREEIERGCNGEGRIQGGIATVPGFGWWPIKAYRPCPAYVATGGRYTRTGQSMDEVVSGTTRSTSARDIDINGTRRRKK